MHVARVVQADTHRPGRRIAEMRVRVDEAGQQHAVTKVGDLGRWSLEREDVTLVADGDDPVAPGGDGLGFRARWVDCPDAAAAEDEVGRHGRR